MKLNKALALAAFTVFAGMMQAAFVPDCHTQPTPDGCTTYAFGGASKSGNPDLGSTYSFAPTAGTGSNIVASGFTLNSLGKVTSVDLYSKGSSVFPPPNDESGIGLVNDRSGDHEITPGSFIELNLGANSYTSLGLYTESTTDGEEWEIWGSNTAAHIGNSFTIPSTNSQGVITGYTEGDQNISSLAGDRYIFITAVKGNVLLGGLEGCTAAPEPASVGMLSAALIGLGLLFRKKATKAAVQTAQQ
jgi:hypothetical protein